MISYKVYNQEAQASADLELSEKIFGLKANDALVHQAVVAQMGNERKVLAYTKDRSEVRGSGKKPWKQKGTGRARVGSVRSPIWKGGGVTFGPSNDRNFSKKLNDKMRRKAICIVLSDKVATKHFTILDALEVAEYKTKVMKEMIEKFEKNVLEKDGKRSLLVIDAKPAVTVRSSMRNLPDVKLIAVDNINMVDLLKYKNVIITKKAVETIEERYK
jgi:large subunit ribosomal protein L4